MGFKLPIRPILIDGLDEEERFYQIPNKEGYAINGCYRIINLHSGDTVTDVILHHHLRNSLSKDWDDAMLKDILDHKRAVVKEQEEMPTMVSYTPFPDNPFMYTVVYEGGQSDLVYRFDKFSYEGEHKVLLSHILAKSRPVYKDITFVICDMTNVSAEQLTDINSILFGTPYSVKQKTTGREVHFTKNNIKVKLNNMTNRSAYD